MSLFKRKAKSTARSVLSGMKSSNAASRASSAKGGGKDEELEALKAQLEEEREKRLRAEWRIMYDAGCDGECEECAYYDVCDGDFVDEAEPESEQLKTEKPEVEKPKADKPQVEESEVATAQQAEDATAVANQVAGSFGWSTDSFEVTTIGPDWWWCARGSR